MLSRCPICKFIQFVRVTLSKYITIIRKYITVKYNNNLRNTKTAKTEAQGIGTKYHFKTSFCLIF